jgi:membrane peptidoglycan carboxypeptidase
VVVRADRHAEPTPGRTRADVALGHYPVAVTDLATVYATFGAGGRYAASHFVAAIRFPGEKGAYRPEAPAPRQVLPAAVAADVSYVLSRRVDAVPDNSPRTVAAINATVPFGAGDDISDAWCARYTRRLAVVAWLGHNEPARLVVRRHERGAVETVGRVCAAALRESGRAGAPPPLPPPAYLGRTDAGNAALPAPPARVAPPSPEAAARGTAEPTPPAPTGPRPSERHLRRTPRARPRPRPPARRPAARIS